MANLAPLLWDETNKSFIKIGDNIGAKMINSYDIPVSSIDDTDADSGKSIKGVSSTGHIKLIDIDISEVNSGYQSISVRLKSSKIDTTSDIVCLKVYKKQDSNATKVLLNTANIKANDFKAINTYENFGLVTNFSGGSSKSKLLNIEVYVLGSTSATIYLDYIQISPTFSDTFGLSTT